VSKKGGKGKQRGCKGGGEEGKNLMGEVRSVPLAAKGRSLHVLRRKENF